MAKKYKSNIFEDVHAAVSGMNRAGTVDQQTMRHFDELCLTVPPAIGPKEIKKLRESLKVSQPLFARYLNMSEITIEKWETGAKRPSGMALKLLSVVRKHGLEVLR